MRILRYTITLDIPEACDFEAVTSTFDQYIEDFNKASEKEFPSGYPEAIIQSIETLS